MTTTLDIIRGALRGIGQYTTGETIDGQDAQDALDVLNGMLDMWSNEHLAVYNNIENVVNFVSGKAVYSVGPGGDWNIPRPLRISSAYTRITSNSTVDFPCDEISFDRYSSIGMKSQPGPWPKAFYYNTNYPLGEIRVWPVPQAGYEFHIWADMLFSGTNALTDVISMPPGYVLGLQRNLSLLLAPEYGVSPSPELKEQARSFKRILKDTNATPQAISTYDGALVIGNANDAGFILTGGF